MECHRRCREWRAGRRPLAWIAGASAKRALDVFAAVGIAVGRIGSLLGGLADDTYGISTALPWGVDFGDGVARHPTQAYEIVFLLALGYALHLLQKRTHPNGALFRYFMAAYLTSRLLIDFLKPEPLIAGMNLIQWACLGGLVVLIAAGRRPISMATPNQGRLYG